jgi:hypothetical protein
VKIPSLTHRSFLLLSALIDGADRTYAEICEAVGWSHSVPHFICVMNQLRRRHLAVQVRFPAVFRMRRGVVRREGKAYRITAAGREAWAESLDFYAFFAERRVGKSGRQGGAGVRPKPGARINHDAYPRRASERPATDAEAERLLRIAPPEFAFFYRALRFDVLTIRQIVSIEIRDIDFARRLIYVRDGKSRRVTVPASEALLAIIHSAIGSRMEGQVFLSNGKKTWSLSRARQVFVEFRRAAGLPPSIVMRGRVQRRRN